MWENVCVGKGASSHGHNQILPWLVSMLRSVDERDHTPNPTSSGAACRQPYTLRDLRQPQRVVWKEALKAVMVGSHVLDRHLPRQDHLYLN